MYRHFFGSTIPLTIGWKKKVGLLVNKDNKEKTLIEFIKHIKNNITSRSKKIVNFV